MKHVFPLFFLIFASVAVKAASTDKNEIRTAIPAGLAPPLLIEKKGKIEGLVVDYVRALAEVMKRRTTFSVVTRYRLDSYLLKGQTDVLCYTSTLWASNQSNLDFSKTLFLKREIVVGPSPMPKTVEGLKGKTIGTMLQYVYPRLDPYFASKKIIRDDNTSEEANLKKLLHNRISYVVTDQLFLDYFRMENPDIVKNRQAMFLKDYPISCSISRQGKVSKKDLDHAIDEVKRSGKMEQLFEKYGSTYFD
ncbi:ABC transporter substrate-binding protein [Bdellovibrio sp. KM01]|uniref:substrate-binding periplasmic protein n=1 Tax=Bdellovibrio sp. KM01 TaxID=2748865 RepID=UPI0015EAC7F1|nr:transporter substrate-binding domain-containing protein [Bdellovibrio sp. KM01]QLY24727.1 transporter substrate-binding domain-containing protein [Bdellovibrio sp. KM01]